MKSKILRFIRMIPEFYRLFRDYELGPEDIRFSLRQYSMVICEITGNRMSKLGYKAEDILRVMRDYTCQECYEEMREELGREKTMEPG